MLAVLLDNDLMNSILELAIEAAKLAGKSIQIAAEDISALNIEQKSLHDYVSEVDRESERIIVQKIQSEFPDHQIIGEEYGQQGSAEAEYQWIIDPLDGTTNFLRSIPHYAVSIGVRRAGKLEHGVVFDPAKNELFAASRGQGSTLNGKPIRVAQLTSIRGALLSTGVPFSGKNLEEIDAFTGTMTDLLKLHTSGVRRLGAAALDLAYVAAGRYDGFWEAKLKIWDIAAGILIVNEAGGKVSDLHGEQSQFDSGNIIAANLAVHKTMLSVATKHYS
ncbi:MAG: myo-inositol-1(or 4)-monophosphatase [Cryomorphaceae bacterium]|jgi:myo-inositol-1(or 4)-monophosphatase